MKLLMRIAIAALAGFVASLSMPPREAPWILLPLGVAAMYACAVGLRSRSAALVGLAGAFGYFAPLLKWMEVVGIDAWMLLIGLCSIWWLIAFALLPVAQKFSQPALAFATLWASLEILRDTVPWGGFGWAQFGMIVPLTPFVGLASNLGQIPTTWLIIAISCLAVEFVRKRRLNQSPILGLAGLAVIALAFVPITAGVTVDDSQTKKISVVQGGVDYYGLGTFGDIRSVLRRHIEATRASSEEINTSVLVVWPENAADVNPMADSVSADLLNALVAEITPPILMGAVVAQPDNTLHNVSLLWSRAGYSEKYVKRKVVPFGEFMPFREFVTSLTERAALMPRDFSPGTTHGSLNLGNFHVGILICFEAADSGFALTDDDQASIWVIHTNNATYQFQGQSEQQLLAARMRAAETRRPVLVSSTSGISAIIDSQGQVKADLSQTETGTISETFNTIVGKTPAMYAYAWWRYGLLANALLLLALGARRRLQERRGLGR